MRRTLPLLLSVLLAAPMVARAEGDDEEEKPAKKKSTKGDSAEGKPEFDDLELTPKRKKPKGTEKTGKAGKADKSDQDVADKGDKADKDGEKPEVTEKDDEDAKPKAGFPRHRYGYVLGGGFFVAGLAFAYSAQGEGKRAETIGTAREASQALDNARASAATANVIYGVAAVTLAITLVFELLPPRLAEKASLTFHF